MAPTHPRVASLAPAGQFTSSQSPKDSACQIGASFSPRDCTTGIPFGHHGASPLAMTRDFLYAAPMIHHSTGQTTERVLSYFGRMCRYYFRIP